MNPVITARVPEHIRNRGIEVLNDLGSNTSELVNAAFEYVISEKRLPMASTFPQPGKKQLSDEQLQETLHYVKQIHVAVPHEWNHASFEELFDKAMGDKYASLS